MAHLLALLATGCVVFASTNVDDLLLLVAFLGHPEFATRHVVVGQLFGIGILTAVALIGSGAAGLLTPAHVGLLGLVPIALGLWRLRRLNLSLPEESLAGANLGGGGRPALVVTAATIADGGDNLAAYVPFFAAQGWPDRTLTVALFAALTVAWLAAAALVAQHPASERLLRRYGRITLPLIMIGLGIAILVRTGAVPVP